MPTSEAPTAVAVAEAAAAVAEEAVAAVNRRIDAGDPGVTADELIKAETEAHIARARRGVAHRQAVAQAAEARLAGLAELRASLPERLDLRALDRAAAKLTAAIEDWVAACAAYDAVRSAVWDEVSRETGPTPGLRLNDPGDGGYGVIAADGIAYRRARVQTTIQRAARQAIGTHYPRTEVRLSNPQD